jgi:hypothetical protein
VSCPSVYILYASALINGFKYRIVQTAGITDVHRVYSIYSNLVVKNPISCYTSRIMPNYISDTFFLAVWPTSRAARNFSPIKKRFQDVSQSFATTSEGSTTSPLSG